MSTPGNHPYGARVRASTAGPWLVGMAVVLLVASFTLPSIRSVGERQRLEVHVRAVADALIQARGQAIRSGIPHVVRVGPDPAGVLPADLAGFPALVVSFRDADRNCRRDAGEPGNAVRATPGIRPGVRQARRDAPGDEGSGSRATGSTFADAEGAPRPWLLFRPDGVPIAFQLEGDRCRTIGQLGSGAGTLYLTNGDRDAAVSIDRKGAIRIHAWDRTTQTWTRPSDERRIATR